VDHTGGCRCGELRYRVEDPFGPVVNCHCAFCRHVHGAAFTTVAFVAPERFHWLCDPDRAARWRTPMGAERHFCGRCATPLYNLSSALALGAVVTNGLDGPQPEPWAHVNTESMLPWLSLGDDLPRYLTWPTPEQLFVSLEQHPDAWVPVGLLGPAAGRLRRD
jgi:hypothetical protein